MAKVTITIEDGTKDDGKPCIRVNADSDNSSYEVSTPAEEFAEEIIEMIEQYAALQTQMVSAADPNPELN